MKSTRMLGMLLALLAACSIALVACGGGDDDGDVDADATSGDDDDSGSNDDADGSTSTDDDVDLSDISEECIDASLAYSAVISQSAAAFTGDTDAVEDSADKLKEFADKAPDEIKDDFEAMAETLEKYYEELEDLDLGSGTPSAGEIAKIVAAGELLQEADFQAASGRVSEWVEENCDS
jgi:hypothetical protein